MTVDKGIYKGIDSYKHTLHQILLTDSSQVHYDLYRFGNTISAIKSTNSLTYKSNETDINKALEFIKQNKSKYRGILLLSDGIYTVGRNPSYSVSNMNVPIYCIGMGDTVQLKDLVIQQVKTNDKAYLHTISPVSVTVLNNGFPHSKVIVDLVHNGKLVSQKSFFTAEEKSSHLIQFDIKPQKTGLQQYVIKIPSLKGEWTDSNNKKVISLDVLNNKIKIMDLSFEIHPDVKTIRSILESDKSINLYERTWISGDRFIGGNLSFQPDSLDLIILHGFPNPKIPVSVIHKIKQLCSGKPLLLITSPLTDLKQLSDLFRGQLPLVSRGSTQFSTIKPRINEKQKEQSILDLPSINYSELPKISAQIKNVHPAVNARVLYYARYHDKDIQSPLLATSTIGNKRVTEINFFNFYKWYQDPNGNIRKFVIALINNVVKWTSSSPDNRLLKISPLKKTFDESEDALLTATLQNANGEPENNAAIDVELKKPGTPSHLFSMNNRGLGQYRLSLGHLSTGVYEYQATAHKGNLTLDKERGQFSVGSVGTEFINTTRNDAMLKFIAHSTGGRFYPFNQVDKIHSDLEKQGLFKPEMRTSKTNYYLYRSPLWFIGVILLLTAEWGLRKYLALP